MSASGSSRLKKGKNGPFYDGFLTQPIRVADTSVSSTAEAIKNNWHIPGEWLEKMLELLSFYKIETTDPERWFALAFNLALEHVPGFRLDRRRKAGAPLEWDGMMLARLNFEVSTLTAIESITIKAACEAILADYNKRRTYPVGPKGKPLTATTLMRRYHQSRNDPLVKMLQMAAAHSKKMREIVIAEIFAVG